MANPEFEKPFYLDIRGDLSRVDDAITKILKDRDSWNDFLNDPNGTLTKMGFQRPGNEQDNARVNQIFYACLVNKDLMQMAIQHFTNFNPSSKAANEAYIEKGMDNSRIQNLSEFDLEAVNYIASDSTTMANMFSVAMQDLNVRGLLGKQYTQAEIDDFVSISVTAVSDGDPVSSIPTFDTGPDYASALAVVVGPVAVGVAAAQVGGVVTAVAWGAEAEFLDARINPLLQEAMTGDQIAVNKLFVLGRLLDFSADLFVHIQNFERRYDV